jgi:signal transduction histidine kinase
LAPRDEAVQQALAQAQRLEQLASALLDLARLEGDTAQAGHARVALPDLLQAVGERYASRAEQAGLAFDLNLPAAPLMVLGDPAQLRRAVGNLLENALKFTPAEGRVALTLRSAAGEAVVVIEDTGIGIPPEDLPRLFERFHRGRNVHAYPGNGLGLAIVKAIIEGHGGRVWVESAPGQGTKFYLTLPAGPE